VEKRRENWARQEVSLLFGYQQRAATHTQCDNTHSSTLVQHSILTLGPNGGHATRGTTTMEIDFSSATGHCAFWLRFLVARSVLEWAARSRRALAVSWSNAANSDCLRAADEPPSTANEQPREADKLGLLGERARVLRARPKDTRLAADCLRRTVWSGFFLAR